MNAESLSQLGGFSTPVNRRNPFTQPVSRLSIPCQMRTPETNGIT